MRHGLQLLADRPHRLAGAVLDSLVTAVLEPRPTAAFDWGTAVSRVCGAVAEGFRLSVIGPTTGQGRQPDDVLSILDLMVPQALTEAAVMAECAPDLFGGPGLDDEHVYVTIRDGSGRASALGDGVYWNVLNADRLMGRFQRLSALATDLAAGRTRDEGACSAVFGLIASRSGAGAARTPDELTSFQLRFLPAALRDRASVLRTSEIIAPPGKLRDWVSGQPVVAFQASVFVIHARPPR